MVSGVVLHGSAARSAAKRREIVILQINSLMYMTNIVQNQVCCERVIVSLCLLYNIKIFVFSNQLQTDVSYEIFFPLLL